MTDVYVPVREAQRMWERTAPQLTLDVDALEDREGAEGRTPRANLTSGQSPSRSSNATHKIGAGTELLAVPGNSPTEKGMEAPCSGAIAREGRPAPNINTNGSGHAHSEGAREAGATGGTS